MAGNQYTGINPIIVNIARKNAIELIRKGYFVTSDLEDLEQELIIDVLSKIKAHNPTYLPAFAKSTVENKAKDLIRINYAKKRGDEFSILSLDAPVNKDDESHLMLTDTIFYDHTEQIEFGIDIESIISKLPCDLKELFELLQTMNITDIARKTGKSRDSIYEKKKKLKHIISRIVTLNK